MADTKIEWTDKVWNPVVGCTKVSQGCKNCYAERIYERFHHGSKFTDVHCYPFRLVEPRHWKKPARIFVNSMSDLFHKDVPDEFIYHVFKAMSETPWHTFQILTKRPERMYRLANKIRGMLPDRLNHVWLGVSVEDQKTADERLPWLFSTRATVRFVSCEPLLGPVDLSTWLFCCPRCGQRPMTGDISKWRFNGDLWEHHHDYPVGHIQVERDLLPLEWVIAGCESGPHARTADPNWFHSLRYQCRAAGVPFFLKQMTVDGKLVKMPELDGKIWKEFPKQN